MAGGDERGSGLSDRQERECAYHRQHAARQRAKILAEPVSFEPVHQPERYWWNAYWHTYRILRRLGLRGKKALVAGCGFGQDAIRLTGFGAYVSAFDLSPESLEVARALTAR